MTTKKYFPFVLAFILIAICLKLPAQEELRKEILHHGEMIRQAFANSDIDKIRDLHHPKVIKALGYNDLKVGRKEVIEELIKTLENFSLEFIKNEVESILIQDNIAIEQTKFSIKGTPKKEGNPFVFSGRTMVTYLKSTNSPSGWVTIREMIQPATK